MKPITNSPVKEQIRQRNESLAQSRETQIKSQFSAKLQGLTHKETWNPGFFITVSFILLLLFGVNVDLAAGIGVALLPMFLLLIINASIRGYNDSIDKKKQQLADATRDEIRREYNLADQRTQQEIDAYDRAVSAYSKKILAKPESINKMVDHSVKMFERMISHADSRSHIRFIKVELNFKVNNDGITFSYPSRYINPLDDFDFERNNFRNLSSPEACEGLAKALTSLIIKRIKQIYPPNSVDITLSHTDADVRIHFQGANANFIPPIDIV